jgi:hypothetical protein
VSFSQIGLNGVNATKADRTAGHAQTARPVARWRIFCLEVEKTSKPFPVILPAISGNGLFLYHGIEGSQNFFRNSEHSGGFFSIWILRFFGISNLNFYIDISSTPKAVFFQPIDK